MSGIPGVVGIDLGTTYSCIAHVDEFDRAVVIPNTENQLTTPSVVLLEGNSRVVGNDAKSVSRSQPDDVVQLVKRQMGSADWRFYHGDDEHDAPTISAYILKKLANDAEISTGIPVTRAVITCPAYFGINEREATKNAGLLAGLDVLGILYEPVAAAIAYSFTKAQGGSSRVLVYDLGGGTFDVTYIDISPAQIKVVATGGNHELGGRNWDELVVHYLADQWKGEYGDEQDPLDDPMTVNELFNQAEAGKKALSTREPARMFVQVGDRRTNVQLDRATFDSLTSHLLEQTINLTTDLLGKAEVKGYGSPDIILLVGGSTYMPQVARRVEEEFGITTESFDPDQAVAKGAAIYADLVAKGAWSQGLSEEGESGSAAAGASAATGGGLAQPAPAIIQNTSRSFGVVVWTQRDGRELEIVANLIKAQDSLPASSTQTFGTHSANQDSALIRIVENFIDDEEADLAMSNEIGLAELPLPAGLPQGAPIEVTFTLDESGLLRASGREMTTFRTVDAQVNVLTSKSEEEIQQQAGEIARLLIS